jgi:hypothetical protein
VDNSQSNFGLKLKSEKGDPFLFKIIRAIQEGLIKEKLIAPRFVGIEEIQVKGSFFYILDNKRDNLRGFIGRDKDTGVVQYLIKDKSRIKWARLEGFCDNLKEEQIEEFVYTNIGIVVSVDGISSFINFLGKKGNFTICPPYKKSPKIGG